MNPKTKIFINGRRINGRFDSLKAKARRATHWTLVRVAFIVWTAFAVFFGGMFYSTASTSYAWVQAPQAEAPILTRIATCESGNTQTNKNGQVVININTNHTVDIGKFQVNSIHEAEAHRLGYDLFTDEGNTAYAKFLYANRGTGDWASSQGCWGK